MLAQLLQAEVGRLSDKIAAMEACWLRDGSRHHLDLVRRLLQAVSKLHLNTGKEVQATRFF